MLLLTVTQKHPGTTLPQELYTCWSSSWNVSPPGYQDLFSQLQVFTQLSTLHEGFSQHPILTSSPVTLYFPLQFNLNTYPYLKYVLFIQFSSVTQSCPTLWDPMNRSMPGLPVHHQLPEITQTHVHWVGDAIQPSYPLSSPSPPALNLAQHQGLFKWVSSFHQEFQL